MPRRRWNTGVALRVAGTSIAVAIGFVAVVSLLQHLAVLAHVWDLNSDLASAKLLSGEIARGHLKGVRFGYWTPYTTVALDAVTLPLPHHLGFWQAWPYLTYLVSLGVLVTSMWRAFGRTPAVITASLGVTLALEPIDVLVVQYAHGPTYASFLLAAALVIELPRSESSLRRRLLTISAIVIFVVNIASDPYMHVVVSLPLFATAAAWWFSSPRRRDDARSLAIVATASSAGGLLLERVLALMLPSAPGGRGLFRPANPMSFPGRTLDTLRASRDAIAVGTQLPDWFTGRVALAAIAAGIGLVWAVLAGPLAVGQRRLDTDRGRLELFASLGALCVIAAVVVSAAASPGPGGVRYLVSVPLATAIVVGLAADSRRGALALTLAVVVAACGCIGIVRGLEPLGRYPAPLTVRGKLLAAALKPRGVTYGYGPYWDASGLTLAGGSRITIRPVRTCGARLCPPPYLRAERWYAPRTRRTFLVIDPAAKPTFMSATPPANLGAATEEFFVGAMHVFVYDHDISASFGKG
ncbi:MAG: hypothetical protein QOK28_1494 [Actinomycetota bacterium]